MKLRQQKITTVYQYTVKIFILVLLFSGTSKFTFAQCPPNIDFEEGTFNNWQCWSGSFNGTITLFPTPPVPGRHDMLSNPPGNGFDYYGGFPKNCPNGSNHSIKIGDEVTGTYADAVSYTFTIPAGQNTFNLIYHYAIILNDAGHPANLQPRLVISSLNVTDGTPLPCPLPPIVVTGGLPGFEDSPNPSLTNGSLVRYKDWAAASMKMDNLAGKTIKITFTVTGCGLTNGSHFGYAYIDLNSECSSSFIGAVYCHDDAFINVTAPSGYQNYTWWDAAFTMILGNTQTINFTPPPPSGTIIKVVLTPYAGYGCVDTLTAVLLDTLTIHANAGPDRLSCNNAPVQLGENSKPGYVYSWSPITALSNPNISNPIATPSVTTQYVVTTSHDGGGCVSTDTVIVYAAVLSDSIQLIGPAAFCSGAAQIAVLKVFAADSIQWYRNNVAIPGANQIQYNVLQSGSYYATLFSFTGCSSSTAAKNIIVYPAPLAGFTKNSTDQCFKNNQFIFTNTSSVSSGTLQYLWNLGDGTTDTNTNVMHNYVQPGNYTVKLFVTSDNGCIDSSAVTVHVFASPLAAFTENNAGQCLKNNQFVFSNTSTVSFGNLLYNWDMGDGSLFTSKDVSHSYAQPGSYIVKLLTTTDNGCKDSSSFNITVYPQPVAAFTVNNAQQCFTNNQFIFTNGSTILSGMLQYQWDLGDGSTASSVDITHNYAAPGNYSVKMLLTSDKGCLDNSSLDVKIFPFASADFTVQPVCINLDLPLVNKTINNTATNLNYLWDFGNGQSSALKNPVYQYPTPGTYTINLTVNTNQCPLTSTTKQLNVVIDAPVAGITYPAKDAVLNFPEPLQARQIGATAIWSPAVSLDNPYSYNPRFNGINPQLYTIRLLTLTGCLTIDTQMVKTHKKIKIYVPTAFTPGNDGKNDYLRPLLMGFSKVNYFRIYNRWGKLIFQMQSDRPGWDGKVNNMPMDTQTVVWMIEAIDVDGVVHRDQGTTVLLR